MYLVLNRHLSRTAPAETPQPLQHLGRDSRSFQMRASRSVPPGAHSRVHEGCTKVVEFAQEALGIKDSAQGVVVQFEFSEASARKPHAHRQGAFRDNAIIRESVAGNDAKPFPSRGQVGHRISVGTLLPQWRVYPTSSNSLTLDHCRFGGLTFKLSHYRSGKGTDSP
jgi:hypothetical protein